MTTPFKWEVGHWACVAMIAFFIGAIIALSHGCASAESHKAVGTTQPDGSNVATLKVKVVK